MAYATTHDQKTFYVQGGSGLRSSLNNQFFSLDLTQPSWNTTSPPWKTLPVGFGNTSSSPIDYGLAMAISKDNTQLLEWGTRTGVLTFDIGTGVWSGQPFETGPRLGFLGYQAATDPNSGLAYIPSAMNNATRMMVYNFVTRATTAAPMPSAKLLRLPVGKYAWAWNDVRQSMLLHGGANHGDGTRSYFNPNLLEFTPATSTWRRLTTKGQRPPPLTEHCMVSAQGGSKMVVYGGTTNANSTLQGDVYILDVASLTWTKGPKPGTSQFRRNMACTAAGDNFVVWGGQSFNLTFLDTAVFDLRNRQWTTQFHLDLSTPTTTTPVKIPTPTYTGDNDNNNDGRNSANSVSNPRGRTISIVAGVASSLGLLIVGACVWFCLRRRKQRNGTSFSRIHNVNINNKPKRASKRWSGRGPANNPVKDAQLESMSLQHQLFEQERRSQERSISRSNSEKSDSVQLLSPTSTDNSDTLVGLNSGGVVVSNEEWLRRQREEVNQERQALALIQMQQIEYQRQMEELKAEAYTR
ncbi:hypothetical protein BGZ97_005612 [Linnemannia gamsii]|uniref:Galactose oxidase n=1 Tax=Linnemannia gamsii TaxID=64522 RepID=A0A9P6UG23_9FUNG|nr:hypothetical protein BGZ97_005612 [Linnemannia gamsii]